VEGLDPAVAAQREAQENGRLLRAARSLRFTLRPGAAARVDLAELHRRLHSERSMAGMLDRVVRLALQAVPGCDHASVTLPGPATPAATDGIARRLDSFQYALGEGPCLEALASTSPVLSPDLGGEKRWSEFAAVAVRSGLGSALCCRLTLGGEALGSLNLYAAATGAFGPATVPVAAAYAAHAAAALARVAEHEQVAQLRQAVTSDRMVGTAIALLMGTRRISEAEAFDLLRVVSQHTNRKLRDVAVEVVRHGGSLT
jgi:GAF domain-containing protein